VEQAIKLYRLHTGACIHGYRTPIYEGQTKLPDCTCPIVGRGYLRNELDPATGKPERINNRTLGKKGSPIKDWDEARAIRERWYRHGHTKDGLEIGRHADLTIEQAVQFFTDFQNQTDTAGENTAEKYRVLFHRRLIPWCKANGIHFIKQLGVQDDSMPVQKFFISWESLRNPIKPLATNTKRAEMERLKSFLERCRRNGWIAYNHAGEIKMGKVDVTPKFPFTVDEYNRLMDSFELWTDEYDRIDTPKSKMVQAYAYCLRYLGQRLSDTAMLGPANIIEEQGRLFIGLTQIKTGKYVKIPVSESLVNRLRSLPFRGELKEAFVLKLKRWTITYPAQGYWFWTGECGLENNSNSWSMDIGRVINHCQKEHGKFRHYSTPHTFRHFFAISMLNQGVKMERVSEWLGHSSVLITKKHYGHANKDWHDASHDEYMRALEAIEGQPKKAGKLIKMPKTG
jgi:integrase